MNQITVKLIPEIPGKSKEEEERFRYIWNLHQTNLKNRKSNEECRILIQEREEEDRRIEVLVYLNYDEDISNHDYCDVCKITKTELIERKDKYQEFTHYDQYEKKKVKIVRCSSCQNELAGDEFWRQV